MPVMELSHPMDIAKDRPPDADEDAVLLRRYCDSGNSEAMEVLFQRHSAVAYQIALRSLGNAADAEDAVQTAFCVVLQRATQFKQQSSIRGWIMGIVLNTCRTKFRDENCRRRHERSSMAIRPAETNPSLDSEMVSAALQSLNELPERYRVPVFLRYMAGFSYDEVASALSLNEETARRQTNRGIEQIRQSLAAMGLSASMVAIPELLASSPLPAAPAALTGSIHALVAGSAKGGGVAAAKGAGSAATYKFAACGVALLLAVLAAIAFYPRGISKDPKQDAGGTPLVPAPKLPAIDKALASVLDKKIDAIYRQDTPSEVLEDLERRAGLRSAIPGPWDDDNFVAPVRPRYTELNDMAFQFSFEKENATVKEILEKLAAIGQLDLEYHGNTAVFFKKTDDAKLAAIGKKATAADAATRTRAAGELGELSDKRVYPMLFKLLGDKDENVVAETMYVLNENHTHTLRYGDGVDEATEATIKKFSRSRVDAIDLLGRLGTNHAGEVLFGSWKVATGADRARLDDALVKNASPKAAELLFELAQSGDENAKRSAWCCLGKMNDVRALDPLVKMLDAADPGRTMALGALSYMRDPRKLQPFFAAHKKWTKEGLVAAFEFEAYRGFDEAQITNLWLPELSDPKLRNMAGTMLIGLSDPRAIDAIIEFSKSPDPQERSRAANEYLTPIRDERRIDMLIKLTRDEALNVKARQIAAASLARSRTKETVACLMRLADGSDKNLAYTAIAALGRTCDATAIDALCKMAIDRSNPADKRRQATFGLLRARDERAADTLLACLRDADAQLRIDAASGLAHIRSSKATDALILLLKNDRPEVREAACRSLETTRPMTAAARAASIEFRKTNPKPNDVLGTNPPQTPQKPQHPPVEF